MNSGVEDGSNQFSDLPNWLRAGEELIVEEWVHGFDTVFESGLDGLNAFFDALSISWNISEGCDNFIWHGEIINASLMRLTTLSVMVLDEWSNEMDHLGEVLGELGKLFSGFTLFAFHGGVVVLFFPHFITGYWDHVSIVGSRILKLWGLHL